MYMHKAHVRADRFLIMGRLARILLSGLCCSTLPQKEAPVSEASLREDSFCSCQEIGSCVGSPNITKLLICFVIFPGKF